MNLSKFKPIPEFETYLIDSSGNIYSTKTNKILSPSHDKDGYLRIKLSKYKKIHYFRINRLVALTYIPNPNNLPVVNHKNGIKDDNRIENLEWCTISYNCSHWWTLYDDRSSNISKKVNVYYKNKLLGTFDSITKTAKYLDIKNNRLHDYLLGKTKTIKDFDIENYKFEIVD